MFEVINGLINLYSPVKRLKGVDRFISQISHPRRVANLYFVISNRDFSGVVHSEINDRKLV